MAADEQDESQVDVNNPEHVARLLQLFNDSSGVDNALSAVVRS